MLDGAVVDHLASQGSVAYDSGHALLLVTNAGSNTVSVFAVTGDQLRLRQVVRSGGDFPVSIAVHGNAVYVLDARAGGAVQGYVISGRRLFPVAGWHRALGLDPTATPEFTHTPGQVAVSPDGRWLVVTTKANTSAVDVFRLGSFGRPANSPVVTVVPGAVPFAVTFRTRSGDRSGRGRNKRGRHLRDPPERDPGRAAQRAYRAGRDLLDRRSTERCCTRRTPAARH